MHPHSGAARAATGSRQARPAAAKTHSQPLPVAGLIRVALVEELLRNAALLPVQRAGVSLAAAAVISVNVDEF